MNTSDFIFQIIQLDSVQSTNSYAHELMRTKNVAEGTLIKANFQKKGKGQFKNSWQSEKDKNLLFSLLLKYKIPIEQQFLLSKMIALSLKDYLDSLSVGQVKIKWPNDILIDKEKVAGILIENAVLGKQISHSIIGVGLNVNQDQFHVFNRRATSLKLKSGSPFDIKKVLNQLLVHLKRRYKQCRNSPELIHQEYLMALHGFEKTQQYQDQKGIFKGQITSILPNGHLQIRQGEILKSYDLKEVRFLE